MEFPNPDQHPNVIFMLADDQSWYDYSFMRRPNVEQAAINMQTRSNTSIPQFAKTPAIDRLADEGLAFIHGYTAPVCRPTLMSIITGTHLHQHWIVGNDLVSVRGQGQAARIDDTPSRIASSPSIRSPEPSPTNSATPASKPENGGRATSHTADSPKEIPVTARQSQPDHLNGREALPVMSVPGRATGD
jgi:hypothetical protein